MFRKNILKLSKIVKKKYPNYFLTGPEYRWKIFPHINKHFKVKVITPNDESATWDIIHHGYFVNDPLCKVLDLENSPDINIFKEYIRRLVREGISLKAVSNDRKEEVLGVCINSKCCPWDHAMYKGLMEECTDEKMKQLFACFSTLTESVNLFGKHRYPYLFDIDTLAVHPAHYKKGIGYGLTLVALSFARDMGYPMAKCECTNSFSAYICRKCKMQSIRKIPYSEFNVTPESPHVHVEIFVDNFHGQ